MLEEKGNIFIGIYLIDVFIIDYISVIDNLSIADAYHDI